MNKQIEVGMNMICSIIRPIIELRIQADAAEIRALKAENEILRMKLAMGVAEEPTGGKSE